MRNKIDKETQSLSAKCNKVISRVMKTIDSAANVLGSGQHI